MPVYLVTYDLNKEANRPPIVDKVKEFGSWAMLSESSYAISTGMTPEQVHAHFKPLLDSNDTIYIISLCWPWMGVGPKRVNDWLTQSLRRT